MTNQTPIINFSPKKILIFFFSLVALLVALSIWGQHMRFFGVGDIRGPIHEMFIDIMMTSFYLDYESNVPTFINALMLFIPALLLLAIGLWKSNIKDKYRFQWNALAFIFFLLSIDEIASFHERLIKPMRAAVGSHGVFFFAWIIPGMAAIALFGFAFLTFFLHLDKKFKLLFFFSLAVYISGVIGGEMVSGYFAANLGQKNFTYAVVASLEESVEMFGCGLIIYSLLEYIKHYLPEGLTFKGS
ncbi:MAG TPA: hypothetical protein PKJ84_13920 [Anaerolineales bacterium]|nr:hypothetical protein [Anaerolineales bacterium]HNB40800.1 hypothetical protein [Anaerolineales bacterium]HND50213.1 hypothetical protein [Anaerolineales bacterium]HNE03651.1 hypothetical protein [Anaerolineales bacterium]HNF94056.1 hypothetical protein [Anaerolineales bacterium]